MTEDDFYESYSDTANRAVENSNDLYKRVIDDYEDRIDNNEKFDVASRQEEINKRNASKPKIEREDTGVIADYWNGVTDFFGLDSIRTTEVRDGRIYDSRNKASGLYDNMSKDQLIDIIREAPEDDTAEYILYQKKIPIGINEDGSIKYGFKNGIAKNSLFEREDQLGTRNGEELMWSKRIAGAEDIESRINKIAFKEKKGVFDIGESAGTKQNLGSGYTEIQDESFLDEEQFKNSSERKSYMRRDLLSQAAKDDYVDTYGDAGLLNYVSAFGSGALRLTGDLIDLGATGIGFVGNQVGLRNTLSDGNWGDKLSDNADKFAMYNRTASQTAMTESAHKWKNGDYVGALLNMGSLDMVESVLESLPEIALMSLSLGSGAAAKGAMVASDLSKARNLALASNDAIKLAQVAKKEKMLFAATKSPALKEAIIADGYLSATKEILKANAGFVTNVFKNTNNVIEERIKNGDDDVTIAEASAILLTQGIATALDKMAFMSTVKNNSALKETLKNIVPTLSDSVKKSFIAKVTVATAGIAKAMGTEAAQEHIQTWTEILGRDLGVKGKTFGQVISDEKNQDEALKATLAGSVGGGAMHVASGVLRPSQEKSDAIKKAKRKAQDLLNPNPTDIEMALRMDVEDLKSDEYSAGAKFHYLNTQILKNVKTEEDAKFYVDAYAQLIEDSGLNKNKKTREIANTKMARLLSAASVNQDKFLVHLDADTKKKVVANMAEAVKNKVLLEVDDILAEVTTLGSDKMGNKGSEEFDDELYKETPQENQTQDPNNTDVNEMFNSSFTVEEEEGFFDNGSNKTADDGSFGYGSDETVEEEINPLFGVFTDTISGLESSIEDIANKGGDTSSLTKMHKKLFDLNSSRTPPKSIKEVAAEIAEAGLTIDGKRIEGYGSINEHRDEVFYNIASMSDEEVDMTPIFNLKRFIVSRGNLIERTNKGAYNSELLDAVTSENKKLFEVLNQAREALVNNNYLSDEKKTKMMKVLDDAKAEAMTISNKYAEVIFSGANFELASKQKGAKPFTMQTINEIMSLASQAENVEEFRDIIKQVKNDFYFTDGTLDMTGIVSYMSSKYYALSTGKSSEEVDEVEFELLVEQQWLSQDHSLSPIDDDLFDDLIRPIETEEDKTRVVDLLVGVKLSKSQIRKLLRKIMDIKEPEPIDPMEEPAMLTSTIVKQLAILAERANAIRRKGNKNLEEEIEAVNMIAYGFNLSSENMIEFYLRKLDDDIAPVSRDELIGSVEGLIKSLEDDEDIKSEDIMAYRDEIIAEATKTIRDLKGYKEYMLSLIAGRVFDGLRELIDIVWQKINGLEKKTKEDIKFIDKLGKYAATIDSGKKLHHMSIKSLKDRLLTDDEAKKKAEAEAAAKKKAEEEAAAAAKKKAEEEAAAKKKKEAEAAAAKKKAEEAAAAAKKKAEEEAAAAAAAAAAKNKNNDDDDDDDNDDDGDDSDEAKARRKKRLDIRAEELLLEIQRMTSGSSKDDVQVPQPLRTVMSKLKVSVKAVMRAMKLGDTEEKNRSVISMLDTLEKRFKYEISVGFDKVDDTLEYTKILSARINKLKKQRSELEAEVETKDLKFISSDRLKKRYEEILLAIKEKYPSLDTDLEPEAKMAAINEMMKLARESLRINPTDTSLAEMLLSYVDKIGMELAIETNNKEYSYNLEKLKTALRFSSYGILHFTEQIETTSNKLDTITEDYLKRRADVVENMDKKSKQLELIAIIRANIAANGFASIEEIMEFVATLEAKYIGKDKLGALKPSSTTTMFLNSGVRTKEVLQARPTLLSYVGDAISMFKNGIPFKPAMDIISEYSKSIHSEKDLNKAIAGVNLLGSVNIDMIVREYENLNLDNGVISLTNDFFNVSGLLVDENGKISKVLAEAIKQASLLLAPSIEDTRFSLIRYSADEYKKYFGVTSEEEREAVRAEALKGYVPVSYIKKEARRILSELLGVKSNSELSMESRDIINSGLSSMVMAGMKALSGSVNPPFSHAKTSVSDAKKPLNMIKVNMTKEETASLSTLMHITGSSRKNKPSLKPFEVADMVRNSEVEINEYDIEQLKQRNNTKNFFTEEARTAHELWLKEPEALYYALGLVDEEELELLNPRERQVQEVHNASIIRFTDDMFSNYAQIQDKPFYLNNYIMRSGRTSSSGEITPFESKLQRLFLTKESFRKKVKVPTSTEKREPVDMVKDGKDDFTAIEEFEMSLAVYLGIDVDTRSKFHVFSEVRKIVDIYADEGDMMVSQDEEFEYLKEVIDNGMQNMINDRNVMTIFDNRKYHKNGMSYQNMKAAMVIKKLVEAKINSQDEFDNNLTFLADAVSSGIANISMQSGESGSGEALMLEKAGILTDEQMEKRTRYTKFLLAKKYNLPEEVITFNMASLIEAGKYHSDEDTPSDIKEEASTIDDVFYDIYETAGMSLFGSLSKDNVDKAAQEVAGENHYFGSAMRLFAAYILKGKNVLSIADARKIAKFAVMVLGYGAQETTIKRNFIEEDVFDIFYESANSEDKSFFESIIFSIESKEELDKNQQNNVIAKFLANKKNFSRDMPEGLAPVDRLPYLKLTEGVFNALKGATSSIYGDVVAKTASEMSPLQRDLTHSIKASEPIVFAMSKVILDSEVEKAKADNNGKLTRGKYIEIMNRLAKEGNAHAIYGLNRTQAFFKEETVDANNTVSSMESIDVLDANGNATSFNGSDRIKTKRATSAFGAFATLHIHSKDGEAMTAGLDGTDFTSVYDEIEFPSSIEEMRGSAGRYQDSIYDTGKKDFVFGNIAKHIIKMREYISKNGLDDELRKEFNLSIINDSNNAKVESTNSSYPLIRLDNPMPLIAVIGGKIETRKAKGVMVENTKYHVRTYSNGTREDTQSFYSPIGDNGAMIEVFRIVRLTDITGSEIETFALVTDVSLKDTVIKNHRTLTRIDLQPSLDVQVLVTQLYNAKSITTKLKTDTPLGDYVYNDNLENSKSIAIVDELKSDYLVRSGFSGSLELSVTTLGKVVKKRKELYDKALNISHLNTLGVDFQRIEPDNTAEDSISQDEIFKYGEIYSELQHEYNLHAEKLGDTIDEYGEEHIENVNKLKYNAFEQEKLDITKENLDIINKYLIDENKGC